MCVMKYVLKSTESWDA